MSLKIAEILKNASAQLANVSSSAVLDASLLLSHVTGYTKLELFMNESEVLSAEKLAAFEALLERRLKAEPMAYILGEKEFWGLTFKVKEGVLIPRPDTETLVASLIALVGDKNAKGKMADLGLGSGALLLSILSEFPNFVGVGVDISETALAVTRENAENLGLSSRVKLVKSHWLRDVAEEGFDIIVSNPPYIETAEVATLMPDVKNFEPHLALDGGASGLECYEEIIPAAHGKLVAGGLLLLEIGYQQKESVLNLLKNGWKAVQCFKDLAGNDRVVVALKE